MAWLSQPITYRFGQPEGNIAGQEEGVDFSEPFHTPITSLYTGVVTDASYQPWGGQVGIDINLPGIGDVIWYVQHLDVINVVKGQVVKVGDLLGLSGGQNVGGSHPVPTQYSTGPHIETGFDAPWIGGVTSAMPKAFNPLPYLNVNSNTMPLDSGSGTCGVFDVQCNLNAIGGDFQSVNNFFSAIQQPDTWIKVSLIIGGGILAILGLYLLFKDM